MVYRGVFLFDGGGMGRKTGANKDSRFRKSLFQKLAIFVKMAAAGRLDFNFTPETVKVGS